MDNSIDDPSAIEIDEAYDAAVEQDADSEATDLDEMPFWPEDEPDEAVVAAGQELGEGTDHEISANAPSAGYVDEAASRMQELNMPR